MYELVFSNKIVWEREKKINIEKHSCFTANLSTHSIFMEWTEHCIECTVPYCYHTCHHFSKRKDGHCRLSVYGTFPNKNFKGLYNFGADIRLRKWGTFITDLN